MALGISSLRYTEVLRGKAWRGTAPTALSAPDRRLQTARPRPYLVCPAVLRLTLNVEGLALRRQVREDVLKQRVGRGHWPREAGGGGSARWQDVPEGPAGSRAWTLGRRHGVGPADTQSAG